MGFRRTVNGLPGNWCSRRVRWCFRRRTLPERRQCRHRSEPCGSRRAAHRCNQARLRNLRCSRRQKVHCHRCSDSCRRLARTWVGAHRCRFGNPSQARFGSSSRSRHHSSCCRHRTAPARCPRSHHHSVRDGSCRSHRRSLLLRDSSSRSRRRSSCCRHRIAHLPLRVVRHHTLSRDTRFPCS